MIEITKMQFWQIENIIFKNNRHLNVVEGLWKSGDLSGKYYKDKDWKYVMVAKRNKGKVKYEAIPQLVELLDSYQ